ncbi:MAG: DUF4838 domain-containing protein [Bacteroidaceae bacterium]|nr:DUF4838 domain-containing protein [Bacteroidaceae bacterium]
MNKKYNSTQVLLLAVALLSATASTASPKAGWLFRQGKSQYQITVAPQASTSEQTAARELQQYIEEMSGTRLPINNDLNAKGRHIYVGYNERVADLTGAPQPAKDDESFTYRTVGRDLLIWGGQQRGTMYGVFTFLERELGIHWLMPDCTVVPKLTKWALPKLDHNEKPHIGFRYHNYKVTEGAYQWGAHVKENMRTTQQNEYGGQEGYWGCHTWDYFMPAKEFFAEHPEYYCLRDGKRFEGYGQLCLSNPDVLRILTERLRDFMRKNPGHRIYSLSQNDNQSFCQCEKCQAIEQQYGGHSGIIVWFVNQVADAIKDEFPDKFVGTFAYQYSRQPPKGIRPRDNVVIRLCSIECCFAHPLDAGCPQNEAFMRDLKAWGTIAPHLFIWDYIVDYAQYIAPWPNFQVLGPNVRIFGENKAIGIFEEAQYETRGAEFEELKSWTMNQLLWNPMQDVDSLVAIFIDGYYGKAAPRVMDYYRLCQSLVKPDVHYGIYIRENHEIYSDEFNQKAFELLDEAYQTAENETIRERVERVRMQPLYLYCVRHKAESIKNGRWPALVGLMKKYKAKQREWHPQETFFNEFEAAAKAK